MIRRAAGITVALLHGVVHVWFDRDRGVGIMLAPSPRRHVLSGELYWRPGIHFRLAYLNRCVEGAYRTASGTWLARVRRDGTVAYGGRAAVSRWLLAPVRLLLWFACAAGWEG
jgi:hypothetical protein